MADTNIWVRFKNATRAQNEMKSLGNTITKNIAGFVSLSSAAVIAGKVMKDAFKLAAEAEGVERAFRRLNRPNLLSDLRKATKGTVSDLELMKQAVRAENFDIPLKQMSTLLEFAQQRARATGESVGYLTESIVMGIGRKSPMILDNLGISIVKVREEFAKTGDMAEAVGNIAREELLKMGAGAETAADKTERLGAAWENFEVALGRTLTQGTPVADFFSSILEGAAKFVGGGYGDALQKAYDDFNGVVKETNEVLEEHAGKAERVITEYEKWRAKQLEIIEKQQQIAEWTERLNQELFIQSGALERIAWASEETMNTHIMAAYVDNLKAIPVETVKVAKTTDKALNSITKKYQIIGNYANQFSSMWSQALLNQWNEGQNFFDNMVRGFKQMLAAMAAELIAKSAILGLFSLIPGVNTGLLGKSLFGFASGGSFMVGGSGGIDSQLVAFRATPGERVLVQTPEQQTTNNNVTVQFINPIMDQRFVEQDIIPKIKMALKRNMQ